MSNKHNEEAQPQENEQEQEAPSDEEQDTDEGGGEPDYKALYEKAKKDKNGLLQKVKKMEEAVKGESKEPAPQSSNISEDRLDKIELGQIDNTLNAEQKTNILTLKKAMGLSDVSEAYNHPMVQSYLKDAKAKTEKQAKTEKATPKTQTRSNVSGNEPRKMPTSQRDWLKQAPGRDNLNEMAQHLSERFFGNQ